MNSKISKVLLCIGILIMVFLTTTRAHAQDFTIYSQVSNPNGDNITWASAGGQNAVPVTINTRVDVYEGNTPGELRLRTNTYVTGMFMDPATAVGPYYNFLENYGLNTRSVTEFVEVTISTYMGDISYEFDTTLSIEAIGHASIYRQPGNLTGNMYSRVLAVGAFPIRSSANVTIFTDYTSADFIPDWQAEMESEWIVTAGFHIIPAPGSAALLGLAGLMVTRRRR